MITPIVTINGMMDAPPAKSMTNMKLWMTKERKEKMTCKEMMADLKYAAENAKRILKAENLRHVVYAYITKERPNETQILDWHPVKFKTDEEFEAYLKQAAPLAAMIYAIHKN